MKAITVAATNHGWEIKLGTDGVEYCTCPAWRFARGARKSCKHLEAFYAARSTFKFMGVAA